MTTYFKLVKGATKIKMAPPKQKYIEPILLGTADPSEFREIARALDSRISDTAWTIVYKSLVVVHWMMRDGDRNVAIRYYSEHLSFFQLSEITKSAKWASGDIRALERYNQYLKTRCKEYAHIGIDYVQEGYSSLKSVQGKGIRTALDHVESLELQIESLIRNRYSQFDLNNSLLLCAFKLLVQDLLALYNCLNEGIITLLEAFFELSHSDAERTLDLYKAFVDLTEDVVKYLKSGKAVGLKIPVIKHITTKLIRSLEEHLRDDQKNHSTFNNDTSKDGTPSNASLAQQKLEQIRKQKQLLEQQMKTQQLLVSPTMPQQPYNPFGGQQQQPQQPQQDTFSFEQQVPQPTGNPFLSMNDLPQQQTGYYSAHQVTPAFTGAGFGGYSNEQLQPAQTGSNNPFSLETVPTGHRELQNPFTQQTFQPIPEQQAQVQNPFQQAQLMQAPTAPNMMQQSNDTMGYNTQQTTGYNTQQTTGYNPFQLQQLQQQQMQQQQLQQQQQQQLQQQQLQQQQLQQQQQQQLQQQQQMYNQNPNLIDI